MDEGGVLDHSNVYTYSTYKALTNWLITVGASADFLDESDMNRSQFNPKFGLQWRPFSSTTIRGAIFRTLQRSANLREYSTPTIEPTQVAGFNQLYVGYIGEDAWRYGLAWDQKLSAALHAGMEISKRELKVPSVNVTELLEQQTITANWSEHLARAYVYWTPYAQTAFSAEYLYERVDRRDGQFGVESVSQLQTHRLPLSIGYFSPSGFIGRVRTTYYDQQGEFPFYFGPGLGEYTLQNAYSNFWVFDATLGYRLPHRYGMLSLEGTNLFNQAFYFQDTDTANPTLQPKRQIMFKLTLSF